MLLLGVQSPAVIGPSVPLPALDVKVGKWQTNLACFEEPHHIQRLLNVGDLIF